MIFGDYLRFTSSTRWLSQGFLFGGQVLLVISTSFVIGGSRSSVLTIPVFFLLFLTW